MNHSKNDSNINQHISKSMDDQLQINYMNKQIDSISSNANLKKHISLINPSCSPSASTAMLSPASFMSSTSSPSDNYSSSLDGSHIILDNKP